MAKDTGSYGNRHRFTWQKRPMESSIPRERERERERALLGTMSITGWSLAARGVHKCQNRPIVRQKRPTNTSTPSPRFSPRTLRCAQVLNTTCPYGKRGLLKLAHLTPRTWPQTSSRSRSSSFSGSNGGGDTETETERAANALEVEHNEEVLHWKALAQEVCVCVCVCVFVCVCVCVFTHIYTYTYIYH